MTEPLYLLYLDFDGVLHPEAGSAREKELFQHASLLAEVLEPYPTVQIVLSTSWVVLPGFFSAKERLPAALRERVIGSTFPEELDERAFLKMQRGQQVFEDVLRRKPASWLALDDDIRGWPREYLDKFVQTDYYQGISEPAVLAELQMKLALLSKRE